MTAAPGSKKNVNKKKSKKKKTLMPVTGNTTGSLTDAAKHRLHQLQILDKQTRSGPNQRPGSLGNIPKKKSKTKKDTRFRANQSKKNKRFSIAGSNKSVLDDVQQERKARKEVQKNEAKRQMYQRMQIMSGNAIITEGTQEPPGELPLSPVNAQVMRTLTDTAGAPPTEDNGPPKNEPSASASASTVSTTATENGSATVPTTDAKEEEKAQPTTAEPTTTTENVAGQQSSTTTTTTKSNGRRQGSGSGSWLASHIPSFLHRNNHKKTAKPKPKRVVFTVKREKFELYSYMKPTKMLGEGAYAAVCEIQDQNTKKKYAVKKNRDVFSNISDARRILREIKLMIHFDHPHVMSLLDVVPPDAVEREDFKDVYLIMPRMDTTLSKVIRSQQKLSERHIQYFVYQIMRGLEYMHSGGIIHRDLKPENILVDAADCKVKITDFGLARGVIQDNDTDTPMKLTEYVVTRWYRAPEVMCCSRLYDSQIDTWALGCISAELYTRRPLFKGRNHIEQLQLIFHYMGTPSDLSWIKTKDAKKWISQMTQRPARDMAIVLPNSTALTQDFVRQLLIVDPAKRPTVSAALKHPWLKDFYREKDYKKCPKFNISFEFEAKIKTAFGVRHMMYEELNNFYRMTEEKKLAKQMAKERAAQSKKNNNNSTQNGTAGASATSATAVGGGSGGK